MIYSVRSIVSTLRFGRNCNAFLDLKAVGRNRTQMFFFISIAKRVFKTMNFFLHYGLNKIQQKIEFIDINQEILKKITIVFGAL